MQEQKIQLYNHTYQDFYYGKSYIDKIKELARKLAADDDELIFSYIKKKST